MRLLRRGLLVLALFAVSLAGGYLLFVRGTTVDTHVSVPRPVAEIGSGTETVGVSRDGAILSWLSPPREDLPNLSLPAPPDAPRLEGPALAQARVLGAAPLPLRSHLAASAMGDEGVAVELEDGVELRFGDASRAGEKWRSAAAVLADPSLGTLDYVDLTAPRRPAVGGLGYELASLP